MVPTENSIRKLEAAASKLNEKTDQLNSVIERLNERLRGAAIGIPFWLDEQPIESTGRHEDEDSPGVWYDAWFLGYAKLGGEWNLAAKKALVHEEPPESDWADAELTLYDEQPPVPLTRAPRSVRVECARSLPHLITCLTQRAEEYVRDIDRASELVGGGMPTFFVARADTHILRFGDETTAAKAQETWHAMQDPSDKTARDIARRFRAEDIVQLPQVLNEGKLWAVSWTVERPAGGAIPTNFAPTELTSESEDQARAWAQQIADRFLLGELDPWDEAAVVNELQRICGGALTVDGSPCDRPQSR